MITTKRLIITTKSSLDYSDLEETSVRRLGRKIIESSWINMRGREILIDFSLQLVDNALAVALSLILCLEMFIKMLLSGFRLLSALLFISVVVLLLEQGIYDKWHNQEIVSSQLRVDGALDERKPL